jgi:hypothetical protein
MIARRSSFLIATLLALAIACFSSVLSAQTTAGAAPAPPLIKFNGALGNAQGTVGVTFALYQNQTGGASLWLETQNVTLDVGGHYTVYLGASHAQGVPPELFAAGEARWLGVQPQGQAELPRILLAAVPYAMKALDTDTLGGIPASSYVSSQANPADYQALVQTIVEQMKTSGALAPLAASAGATNFTDTTSTQVVGVTQLGAGQGINATSPNGQTIAASNTATTGTTYAVYATGTSPSAIPIRGVATSATGSTRGVQGNSASTSGVAGYFEATATSGTTYGVEGVTDSPSGYGIYGIGQVNGMKSIANATTGVTTAFIGTVNSPNGIAAVFNNNAGGPLASFRNSGVQEIGFDATGDVTAAGVVTGKTLVSTVATGTAPLTVASSTQVANLNATYLGGAPAGSFATLSANTFTGLQTVQGTSGWYSYLGDMGCGGSGSAGLAFYPPNSCTDYALLGFYDGTAISTMMNRPTGGTLRFRENNGDEAVIFPGGGMQLNAPTSVISTLALAGANNGATSYGIYATTPTLEGAGVYAELTDTTSYSNTASAVYGQTDSPSANTWGVYGSGANSNGVYGYGAIVGVKGQSNIATGVIGSGSSGGFGGSFLNTGGGVALNLGSTGCSGSSPLINNNNNSAVLTCGGSWNNASSRALKEDIAPLSDSAALAAAMALEPVTYKYKAVDERHVGFIAEDVPDLVTNDHKSLSPLDIVAVLTKVVQAQQQSLQDQQHTIATLEQQLKAVRQDLRQIKRQTGAAPHP